MAEYDLVEADFQQYYHIDLESKFDIMRRRGVGFARFSRLFINLPPESRIMRKVCPAVSWSWDDEVSSRILYSLGVISAQIANMGLKKGAKRIKPDEQFQPDYITKAKKEYVERKKMEKMQTRDVEAMKEFWRARNPDAQYL